MKFEVIDPYDIYLDPNCTHLYKRWWHKLMFWKTFIYPDPRFKTESMPMWKFNKKYK